MTEERQKMTGRLLDWYRYEVSDSLKLTVFMGILLVALSGALGTLVYQWKEYRLEKEKIYRLEEERAALESELHRTTVLPPLSVFLPEKPYCHFEHETSGYMPSIKRN